jgi:heme/copper-type cytochrome/quinol oxidase subunit 2
MIISIKDYYNYYFFIPIIIFMIGWMIRHKSTNDGEEEIEKRNKDILWLIIPISILIIILLFEPLYVLLSPNPRIEQL